MDGPKTKVERPSFLCIGFWFQVWCPLSPWWESEKDKSRGHHITVVMWLKKIYETLTSHRSLIKVLYSFPHKQKKKLL